MSTSNYLFTNQVSAGYANANIPQNYSWIQVDNNAGRPLYAQASYITNLDGLSVSLTASNVAIGDVHIADPQGLHANVVDVGTEGSPIGALKVLSQDLDSNVDDITIGDRNGIDFATIQPSTSALRTYDIGSRVTNWDVLSAAINDSTYTTLPSNPANEITILNNTGGTMYVKNASKTIGLPIDNNTSVDLRLVGNTNEVAIKASSNNKTVYATFIAYN
jgi:hypothetical protein